MEVSISALGIGGLVAEMSIAHQTRKGVNQFTFLCKPVYITHPVHGMAGTAGVNRFPEHANWSNVRVPRFTFEVINRFTGLKPVYIKSM